MGMFRLINISEKRNDAKIDSVDNLEYALALDILSRIDRTVDYINKKPRVSNTYINRDHIGAVLGYNPSADTELPYRPQNR